jgi:hypothetical protein
LEAFRRPRGEGAAPQRLAHHRLRGGDAAARIRLQLTGPGGGHDA